MAGVTCASTSVGGKNGKSIRTRIETLMLWPLLLQECSSKNGKSIRTRIETAYILRLWMAEICRKNGKSIRTRIETLIHEVGRDIRKL